MPKGIGYRTNQKPAEHDVKVKSRKAGDNPDTKAKVLNDGSAIFKRVKKGNIGK